MGPKNIYAPRVQAKYAVLCAAAPNLTHMSVRIVSQIWVLYALAGCAKPAPQNADDAFRRIQEQEALIALGNEQLRTVPACDPTVEAAVDQVCSASKSLCKIASDLEDRDAHSRCLAGGDACSSARGRAAEPCATNPARDDGARLGR
jgi:hypothetical protein